MKCKMYCIFAKPAVEQMKDFRGKIAAQAGHAYLHTAWLAEKEFPELLDTYKNSDHAYKIALIVDTVEELHQLQAAYKDKCATRLVTDIGFTVFAEPTVTCLGLGPITEDLIGDDLKAIKTFR